VSCEIQLDIIERREGGGGREGEEEGREKRRIEMRRA
jgi:hypothetical protein